jgi:YfiH family protein
MHSIILPAVHPSFEWRHLPEGPALVCHALEPIAPHLFTTNQWSLGSRQPADDERSWREVADAMQSQATRLVRLHQVHGNAAVVAAPERELHDADIIVTRDATLVVAVQAADCVPMLLADRRTGAVGAAHAGWRGMAARVPAAAIDAMAREFGTRPHDLIIALGPSIGVCCYEVGADVREAFRAAGFSGADLTRWFAASAPAMPRNPPMAHLGVTGRPGHWFFDGWSSVRDQLIAAGADPARILAAELCTASHPAVCCSYRRDGSAAGRMAAAIRSRHPL